MWKVILPMLCVLVVLALQLERAIREGSTLRAWFTGGALVIAVVAVVIRVVRLITG